MVGASRREMVGSGLRIERGQLSPTQYGQLHGFRMTLPHIEAARNIIEYPSATFVWGLMIRKDNRMEDVPLECDLETYVDADYARKADDRRPVSDCLVQGYTCVVDF